jgi:putative toxin-antitoxin system antitoxin component (TIGR02293 family)
MNEEVIDMLISVENLISKLKDPKKEMELVRNGLKINIIESFLVQENFLIKDILERLDIPASTYFAKKKHHQALDSYTSEKFIRLISVMVMASEILGKLEAKDWLYRKIPSLGNEVPLNLLDTEAGHRLVTQALLQVKYGIYS